MSRDLLAAWKDGTSGNIRWISKNMEGVPEWAHGSVVEVTGAPFRVQEDAAHIEAMRLGRPCVYSMGCSREILLGPGSDRRRSGRNWKGATPRRKCLRGFDVRSAAPIEPMLIWVGGAFAIIDQPVRMLRLADHSDSVVNMPTAFSP